MGEIPKRVDESDAEDIQDIQKDPAILAEKYIIPVDRIKSIMKPAPAAGSEADSGFPDAKADNTRSVESRAHAFLRYVGFPVVSGSKDSSKFYNPGFDPTGQTISIELFGDKKGKLSGQPALKKNVRADFYTDKVLTAMVNDREQDPIDARDIFERRDASSSLYGLLLKRVRTFKMFDAKDAYGKEKQSDNNAIRGIEADDFFASNPNINRSDVVSAFTNTTAGTNFTGIRHILHPFIVDPRMDNTVMPDTNRIAVPFLLNREALKLGDGIFVLRPGIELIIRERLRDTNNDASVFFQNVENLLNKEDAPLPDSTVKTENELRLTVEALLDDNEISQSAIDSDIKGITNVQVKSIQRLVKTIRAVITHLNQAIKDIEEASQKINWVPIPSPEGPEKAAVDRTDAILNQKDTANSTEIDKTVIELQIRKLNADRRIAAELDLGDFASPFNRSVNDDNVEKIDEELAGLIDQRDRIADRAFKAMGDIEIISGEITGLGLLDILAIYTALWAMEEKAIISMLDDQAFARLKENFPTLLVGAAAERAAGPLKDDKGNDYNIKTALEKFEKKLVNVFNFIDREIARQALASGEEASGTVSADS